MKLEARLKKLDRLTARTDEERWQDAFTAIRESRWSWHHVLDLAGGEDEIARLRHHVMRIAFGCREARQRDGFDLRGDGMTVAASIVSYLPNEQVPGDLYPLIAQHIHMLGGTSLGEVDFAYGFVGALARLVLRTPDGMELRQRLWTESGGGPAVPGI